MAHFVEINSSNKSKLLTLKDIIETERKPHFTTNGNTKLGKDRVWVWSTMKGSDTEGLFVKPLNGYCTGTCGKHCANCTKDCYVNASYRYGSVILGHAVNTIWIKNDMLATFLTLQKQLTRARIKPNIVRINQSGELMSELELLQWIKTAQICKMEKYPTLFYIYTKNYEAVNGISAMIEAGRLQMPTNFTINISIWHNQGVKEYNALKKYPWIKAFVYDDGQINASVTPTTYCMAYDSNGKMNHAVTCDKCRKCFNRSASAKIIGCHSH